MQEITIWDPKMIKKTIYTNQFKVYFTEIRLVMEDGMHIAKAYQCQFCGKYLLSKKGAKNHKCLFIISKHNKELIQKYHKSAIQYLLRFIATSNLPFRAADNDFLRAAFKMLDGTFDYPHKDTLLKEMKSLSYDIQTQMLHELQGKTVSLLMDGSKRWGINYQGLLVYTSSRLYLWCLDVTKNSTANSLKQMLMIEVGKLQINNTKVVAICTDNFSSNKKALDGKKGSAQDMLGESFIRQPCSAHTANLGIEDIFKNDIEFGFVEKEINFLMQNLPEGSYRKGYEPKFQSIRWKSLYRCTSFILKNRSLYQNSYKGNVIKSFNEIEEKIGWNSLHQVLQIMWEFTSNVERDLASIDQIFPSFYKAYMKLLDMNIKVSNKLAEYLFERFTTTCPLQFSILAYFLTPDGFKMYRANIKLQNTLFNSVKSALQSYIEERYFPEYMYYDYQTSLYNYLSSFDEKEFLNFKCSETFWNSNCFEKYNISENFCRLAFEISQIPCSEAAVERVFAALSKITSTNMCNEAVETINARLIVKFDSVFGTAGPIPWENLANNTKKSLKIERYYKYNEEKDDYENTEFS